LLLELIKRKSILSMENNHLFLVYFHVTVNRDTFLIIKPTRCTNFSNLFWNETLHVSDSSSVHHQEFFTLHCTLILFACCQQTCMTYTIAVCTAEKLLMIDRVTIRSIQNFIPK